MAIQAKTREESGFSNEKMVGLFEAEVVEFNKELDSDGKEIKYTGERDGNATFRVAVTLKDKASGKYFPLSFYLENKEAVSKSGKNQWINELGRSMYADSKENLPEKFAAVPVHKAIVGEADLLNFLDAFLNIDRNQSYTLSIDTKKLINGSVKELRDLLKTDLPRTVLAMATVRTVEKDGEVKEYQGVYNRKFIPGYNFRTFVAAKLDDTALATLRTRDQAARENKKGYLKAWEKYAIEVTDPQYGISDAYSISPLKVYNAEDHVVTANAVLDETDASY